MALAATLRANTSKVNQAGTTTFSTSSTFQAGKLAVLAIGSGANKQVSSVTDDSGNTVAWTVRKTGSDGTRIATIVECVPDHAIPSTATFTINWSVATLNSVEVWLYEVSGADASAFDTFATATGTTSPESVGPTAGLAQAAEIAFCLVRGNTNGITFTPAAGWTGAPAPADGLSGLEFKTVVSTAAITATMTTNNGGGFAWAGVLVTYRAAPTVVAPAVTGRSTVTATLVRVRSRSAAIAGAAAVACALVRLRARSATATGRSTVAASLVRLRARAAAATGSSTVTAAVYRVRAFPSAVVGSSAVAAALARTRARAAAASGSSTVAATLGRVRALSAALSGASAVSGAVVRVRARVATALGSSSVFGDVTVVSVSYGFVSGEVVAVRASTAEAVATTGSESAAAVASTGQASDRRSV